MSGTHNKVQYGNNFNQSPPNPPAGGAREKRGPQIWPSTFVTAYTDTRTEITKN